MGLWSYCPIHCVAISLSLMTNRMIPVLLVAVSVFVFMVLRSRPTPVQRVLPTPPQATMNDTVSLNSVSGRVFQQISPGPAGTSNASTVVAGSLRTGDELAYKEVFKGLDTRKWYYRHWDPQKVDEAERRTFVKEGRHFDERLTPLIQLRKKYFFSIFPNANYRLLADLFQNSDVSKVAFLKGEIYPQEKLSDMPVDTPVCIVHFNRTKDVRWISNATSWFFENSNIIEHEAGLKGVRINIQIDPTSDVGFFIHSFECLVRTTRVNDESYKQLLLIHLVATLGIDGDLYGKPSQ